MKRHITVCLKTLLIALLCGSSEPTYAMQGKDVALVMAFVGTGAVTVYEFFVTKRLTGVIENQQNEIKALQDAYKKESFDPAVLRVFEENFAQKFNVMNSTIFGADEAAASAGQFQGGLVSHVAKIGEQLKAAKQEREQKFVLKEDYETRLAHMNGVMSQLVTREQLETVLQSRGAGAAGDGQ